jgi:hypothetical protein
MYGIRVTTRDAPRTRNIIEDDSAQEEGLSEEDPMT